METANIDENQPSLCEGIAEEQIQQVAKTRSPPVSVHGDGDDGDKSSPSKNEDLKDNIPPSTQLWMYLEKLLSEMQSTKYKHKTFIDEKKGIVNCDCSGLLCYLIKKHFPSAYASLQQHGKEVPWRKRPLAVTFYETFVFSEEEEEEEEEVAAENNNNRNCDNPQKGICWKRIHNMMDVQPGDIIAWRPKVITKGQSTGHTCMIGGNPTLIEENEKRRTIRVRVIDSTSYLHSNDTRKEEGLTGLGAGEMLFRLNKEGEPRRFFVRENSKPSKPSTRIAIGRII